jgi:hypothetical protein
MTPPSPRRRGGRPLVLVGLLLALGTAPAAEASFVGEATDPAGDATASEPGRDLVAAGLGYDRATGRMQALARLRDAPDAAAPTSLVGYVGRRTGAGCEGLPTAGLVGLTTGRATTWLRFDTDPRTPSARGSGDRQGSGTALQGLSAIDRRLQGMRPDCGRVALVDPDDGGRVFDEATFALVPQPGLGVELLSLPRYVGQGRAHTLRLRVRNPGDAPTGTVRLRLGAIAGMTAKRAHRVASVAPGRTRTVRVTVRFGSRAAGTNRLRATATAGRLRATAQRPVYVRHQGRRGTGGGSGGGGTSSTCVQFFPGFGGDAGSLGLVPCRR